MEHREYSANYQGELAPDYERAAGLFDIAQDARQLVVEFIDKYAQDKYPDLEGPMLILARDIEVRVFRKACDLLGVSDSTRQEVIKREG